MSKGFYICRKCGWFSDINVGMLPECPECNDKLNDIVGIDREVKFYHYLLTNRKNAYYTGDDTTELCLCFVISKFEELFINNGNRTIITKE